MMRTLQLPILVILLWIVGLPAEEIERDVELRILRRLVETLERQHEQQLLHKSMLQSDKRIASLGSTPLPEDGGMRATNSTLTRRTTVIPRTSTTTTSTTTTTPTPKTGGGGLNWGWRKPWGKRRK